MNSALQQTLTSLAARSETENVGALVAALALDPAQRAAISADAAALVERIRATGQSGLMEKFLGQYGLNTDEGVALMCLAEAYLRTPDAGTLDALIEDKIGGGDWARHLGRAQSSLVNASTWALMLTGKVFRTIPAQADDLASVMRGVVRRLGEPVARTAVGEAMRQMGRQFVLGRNIGEALDNAAELNADGYLHSYDMLGEAARTAKDAARYFAAYASAISAIGARATQAWPHDNSGISVKLSALHPRYEWINRDRVLRELVPAVGELARMARAVNIPLAIDAEEADRLQLSLEVIEAVLANPALAGWDGFGVVVQAYQRRAPAVLDHLHDMCVRLDRRISVRLVKGAYWDAEIKHAQTLGLPDYPVFTRKQSTDISYLACAKQLLAMTGRIYPQFATHNAHTVSAINALAPEGARFEFQRLHGMGEALHEIARARDGRRRRIYAPVGVHKDLLAYLVRRLLENGANSSFVHQLLDRSVPAEAIAADPLAFIESVEPIPHPAIVLPANIYSPRRNSAGSNPNDPAMATRLEAALAGFAGVRWGEDEGEGEVITNPADRTDIVGHIKTTPAEAIPAMVETAVAAGEQWRAQSPEARAAILERTADLYEANGAELMALAIREAGKNRFDAIAELREAVDFLRYYAAEARRVMPQRSGLGAFACISPWNFPLAIFTGQIAGALAAGNTVLAKPAEQTPLIAARAAALFAEAGLPHGVLQMIFGDGAVVGPPLTGDSRLAGVIFTGSTATALLIDLSMARHGNANGVLIAETGGLNAMIVDSTALPEQAVRDILASAFQSAGQRCSALRILAVQRDIAGPLLDMLAGAARELRIGDPANADTDVGPVIDAEAKTAIERHCAELEGGGRLLFKLPLPRECENGTFVAPAAYRLDRFGDLKQEIFGPVLHVIEYEAGELDALVQEINASGYGLTLGIHSRIDTRVDRICETARVGNIYVNRNQIGAVVGAQPFGGEGLSGTGPKAGGPSYLLRLSASASDAQAAHIPEPMLLPGVTGERNTLRHFPRGLAACLGPTVEARQQQAQLAHSMRNTVLECALDDAVFSDRLAKGEIAAVLHENPAPQLLRQMLAETHGRRVPVLSGDGDAFMLLRESCVSEDTTASGGNASLLAQVI